MDIGMRSSKLLDDGGPETGSFIVLLRTIVAQGAEQDRFSGALPAVRSPDFEEIHERGHDQEGVDAIQHAAVTGDDAAGILDAGGTLDQAFDQVAELTQRTAYDTETERGRQAQAGKVEEMGHEAAHGGAHDRADETGACLLWTHGFVELRLAQEATEEVAAGVSEPGEAEAQEDVARAELAEVAPHDGERGERGA